MRQGMISTLSTRAKLKRVLRGFLTEAQAVEIYSRKLVLMQSIASEAQPAKRFRSMTEIAALGKQFHVNPKTIRDVWMRRTWVVATSPLWVLET